MRVTSDCPLTIPEINQKVLEDLIYNNADYSSNNMPPTFPHGLDCEAFTFKTLKTCFEKANDNYDLEHVTPWMRGNENIEKVNYKCLIPNSKNFRITLDYHEDLIVLREIFQLLNKQNLKLNFKNLINVMQKNKDLLKINDIHKTAR